MNTALTFPYEIQFPDFEPSDAVRYDVEQQLKKINRLTDQILHAQVILRAPHRHKRSRIFHVHVSLHVPGHDFAVTQEPEKNHAHADMHIAIRDAFDALKKQIKKRNANLKSHKGARHQQREQSSFAS